MQSLRQNATCSQPYMLPRLLIVLVVDCRFAAGPRRQGTPDVELNRVSDDAHRAIAEQEINATCVRATRGSQTLVVAAIAAVPFVCVRWVVMVVKCVAVMAVD